MIKMYVMHTCPDCEYVEKQVEGNPNFEVIDIGKHVRNLKQFIKLRDTNPAFDEAKAVDDLGIPCYVLEDGTVTLYSKDVGLEPRPQDEGAACSIDGRGLFRSRWRLTPSPVCSTSTNHASRTTWGRSIWYQTDNE